MAGAIKVWRSVVGSALPEDVWARAALNRIFNTDQGSRFTSEVFTGVLLQHGIRMSMDGQGKCEDNIFVNGYGGASSMRLTMIDGEVVDKSEAESYLLIKDKKQITRRR